MSSVVLRGVVKRYGETTVVRGVDLHVAEGERLALLGPSGCGKTTLLRMIAGLETPDGGSILLGEDEVAGGRFVPPEQRRLAMVFQTYAVWPHRNLRDNVAYPLRLQGVPDAGVRADAALAKVKLGGMGDRMPGTLSGGQQQRVAIARALAARPRVLLLDEALCNLDAALREVLGAEIVALAREEGLTVVRVTQDQAEALALSDRVAVMHAGTIAQVGTPEELYRLPRTLHVARVTGALNVVPARRTGGRLVVAGVDLGADAGTDEAVNACFRPEDAHPAPVGAPDALPYTVIAGAYRGATTRWRLRLGDAAGTEVQVDARSGLDLAAHAAAGGGLAFTHLRAFDVGT